MHNPELRLISRSRQDRGVNQRYARTTDKGIPSGWIYSLNSCITKETRANILKVPHILTYGMEGLEGLRVGNADAKLDGVIKFSLIDMEARQGDMAQAKAA